MSTRDPRRRKRSIWKSLLVMIVALVLAVFIVVLYSRYFRLSKGGKAPTAVAADAGRNLANQRTTDADENRKVNPYDSNGRANKATALPWLRITVFPRAGAGWP
jgi:hypothetical protein